MLASAQDDPELEPQNLRPVLCVNVTVTGGN